MGEQGLGAGGGSPGAAGDPDIRETRLGETGGQGIPSGENLPPQMVTRMAQFQSMSEEERDEVIATARACRMKDDSRGVAGGALGSGSGVNACGLGQTRLLLRPLIAMLAERVG